MEFQKIEFKNWKFGKIFLRMELRKIKLKKNWNFENLEFRKIKFSKLEFWKIKFKNLEFWKIIFDNGILENWI